MTAFPVLATRPSYRPYPTRVASVARLSPHFVRVRLSGPELEHFGTAGLDQRLKLILPLADGTCCDIGQDDEDALAAGTWYDTWRALPDSRRGVLRTYTVRRAEPQACSVTVDFVTHPDAGPAGAWAESARVGDELLIVGPDERSEGSRQGLDWHPGSARRVLLAGDETAVPAICGILESLDETYDVDAFLEVPTAADALTLDVPPSFRVRWLAREGRDHGAALSAAVTGWTTASTDLLTRAAAPRPQELADVDVDAELLWDSPEDAEGEFYAWIAGESAMVKGLRRLLVQGCGVDRRRVAFMGYWRLGQSERQE